MLSCKTALTASAMVCPVVRGTSRWATASSAGFSCGERAFGVVCG